MSADRLKVVYVAGPFMGPNAYEIELNIRHAEEYALKVWRSGRMVPICVHSMNRFFMGTAPEDLYLAGDLELLSRCDAIFLIPGWERSSGSQEEYKYALDANIPAFTNFTLLKAWSKQ